MPNAPPAYCSAPGCSVLVASGCTRCGQHNKAKHSVIDKHRPSSNARGYTTSWQRLRIACFVRDGWKCGVCGWQPELIRLSLKHAVDPPHAEAIVEELRQRKREGLRHLHGDHVEAIAVSPQQRLQAENIQTLCNVCHCAKTMRELRGLG